jgi:hypothetical protein
MRFFAPQARPSLPPLLPRIPLWQSRARGEAPMLRKLIVALMPISLLALLAIPSTSAQNLPQPLNAPVTQPTPAQAVVICAGDTAPEGMVITATGSSPVCAGSCTARKIEPLTGSIMIICARQPIPAHYALESITTSPQCKCLGDLDNAYVIRSIPTATVTPSAGLPRTAPVPFGAPSGGISMHGTMQNEPNTGQMQNFQVSH